MDSIFHTGDLLEICRYHERWRFHRDDEDGDMTADQLSTSPSDTPGSASLDRWLSSSYGTGAPSRQSRQGWRPDKVLEVSADMGGIEEVPRDLLAPDRWHTLVAGTWLRQETIHVLERRTSLLGLVRASWGPAGPGKVHVTLGDNLSSILAFEKGRCGGPALRRLVQRAGAICMAAEMGWRHRHVKREDCVADHGSRLKRSRHLAAGVVLTRAAAPAIAPPRSRAVGLGWKRGMLGST